MSGPAPPRASEAEVAGGVLIVFGGLPGTGKTTLARLIAREKGAVFLRVDTIERALRSSAGPAAGGVGPAGYAVACALAEENLGLGRAVMADCVNPLAVTREAWRRVAAAAASVGLREVEVLCSDPVEHRRRLEEREGREPGPARLTWEEVEVRRRAYAPREDRPRIVLETAGRTVAETLAELRARLGG